MSDVSRRDLLVRIGASFSIAAAGEGVLPAPPELLTMLRRAGFADAAHHPLSGGITQLLTGTR